MRKRFTLRMGASKDISGLPLHTLPGDYLERALRRTGVYDLALTELVWQLSQPGALQVDVGANVGYVSRLMHLKAGATGRTLSLEPNPDVLPLLHQNREITPHHENWTLIPQAAGAAAGQLPLHRPAQYLGNHGTATLSATSRVGDQLVEVVPLDELLAGENQPIQLLKIDVEGFELPVLQGANSLLKTDRIRHIVYEDFDPWPGPAAALLQSLGFGIYAIRKGWWGVKLFDPPTAPSLNNWEEPNYLATKMGLEEKREIERKGYTCLRQCRGLAKRGKEQNGKGVL